MTILGWARKRLLSVFAAAIACLFAGCASLGTYNPATGRSELIFITTPQEVDLGNDVHQKLLKEYRLSDQAAETERVQRIGERLVQVSDRKDYEYHFYVVEKDEINAFTTPGGNIYLFTGIMDKLTTDDQVASVIAHEMGHCAARHTVKKYQAALGYNLLGGVVLGQVGGEGARQIASMSSQAVMNLVFSAYGRKDEYESDRLGVKYLRLAGYDPQASVEVLEMLQRESDDPGGLAVLRSHPYLSDRIEVVKKEIQTAEESHSGI